MKKKGMITIVFLALFIVLNACVKIPVSRVESIRLSFQPREYYLIGDQVDIGNILLTATFDDETTDRFSLGNEDVQIVGEGVLGQGNTLRLNTEERGDHAFNVSYGGVSLDFHFSVYDAIVDHEGTGSHETMIAAIEDIPDGGWIYVLEGVYTGRLEVAKSMRLKTSGQAVIDSYADHAVTIRDIPGGYVSIEGFVISGNWTELGIVQVTSSNTEVHLINNWIQAPRVAVNYGTAVQVAGDNSSVIGNTIYVSDEVQEGIVPTGILAVNGNNMQIKNNTIIREKTTTTLAMTFHARIKALENLTIEGNVISGGYYGISVLSFDDLAIDDVSISNNRFINVYMPIYLQGSNSSIDVTQFVMRGNDIKNGFHDLIYVFTSFGLGHDYDLERFETENTIHDMDVVIGSGTVSATLRSGD